MKSSTLKVTQFLNDGNNFEQNGINLNDEDVYLAIPIEDVQQDDFIAIIDKDEINTIIRSHISVKILIEKSQHSYIIEKNKPISVKEIIEEIHRQFRPNKSDNLILLSNGHKLNDNQIISESCEIRVIFEPLLSGILGFNETIFVFPKERLSKTILSDLEIEKEQTRDTLLQCGFSESVINEALEFNNDMDSATDFCLNYPPEDLIQQVLSILETAKRSRVANSLIKNKGDVHRTIMSFLD